MCSTVTVYQRCHHTHMEKKSCKYKRRAGLFCFPSPKSKTCLESTRVSSAGLCGPCIERELREGRELAAKRREAVNRDSYMDPVLNREMGALPTFALQTPPAAAVRQPRTQPQQPRRMPSSRSNKREGRSDTVQRGRSLHRPVPVSTRGPRFADSGRPFPSSPAPGRPRANPNIPRSVTTMHGRDRSVSPIEPGFMDPRSVSPDEFGRAPWHYSSSRR